MKLKKESPRRPNDKNMKTEQLQRDCIKYKLKRKLLFDHFFVLKQQLIKWQNRCMAIDTRRLTLAISLSYICNANRVANVTLRNIQSSIVCERNKISTNTKQNKNARAVRETQGKRKRKKKREIYPVSPYFILLYNFNFPNLAEEFRNKIDCS